MNPWDEDIKNLGNLINDLTLKIDKLSKNPELKSEVEALKAELAELKAERKAIKEKVKEKPWKKADEVPEPVEEDNSASGFWEGLTRKQVKEVENNE